MSASDEKSYLPARVGRRPLHRGRRAEIQPLGIEPGRGETPPPVNPWLLEQWWVVKKRKWVVISLVLLALTAGVTYTYQARPVYRASGKVIIRQVSPTGVTDGRPPVQSRQSDREYLLTELNVLRSRVLAKRVIDELSLRKHPEFTGIGQDTRSAVATAVEWSKRVLPASWTQGLLSRVTGKSPSRQQVGQPSAGLDASQRETLLVDQFLAGLDVELIGGTRIANVTYEAHDPRLATQIVNGLMDQLIEYTLVAEFDSTKQVREWLNSRLAELRQSLMEMQEELVNYSRDNDVVQLGENQTIAVERLTDLTRRLVEAESERIQAETLYRLSQEAQAGRPATGAEGQAGSRPSKVTVDSLPFIMSDPAVQSLRQRLADDRHKLAQLKRQYTEAWPEIEKLKGQIEESEHQLTEVKRRILARIEADYRAASSKEDQLRAELLKWRAQTLQQNERAINLSIRQQQIRARTQLYDGLLQKMNDVELVSTLTTSHIQILDRAQLPVAPVRPRKWLTLGGSLFAGLFLGIFLALFLEYRDTTIKSAEDIGQLLGLPMLGIIPARESLQRRRRLALPRRGSSKEAEQPALILNDLQRSGFPEAFRSLRTAVLLSQAEAPPQSILFTSSLPGEGKTTTAVNMAICLAQTGARVVLVDGDLRKPRLHKLLNVKRRAGLSTYLTSSIELDSVIDENQIENLWVIAAGPIPPNPSELLSSRRMRELVALLSDRYEFIVFDSPPASTPDTQVLSSIVDGVVLVIRCEETAREVARRARQSLDRVRARILGVVLNQVDVQQDEFYYYFYQYYSADSQDPPRPLG